VHLGRRVLRHRLVPSAFDRSTAPKPARYAQRGAEQEALLAAGLDLADPARHHGEDFLSGVLEHARRNPQPPQKSPHRVELGFDQLLQPLAVAPGFPGNPLRARRLARRRLAVRQPGQCIEA